MTNAINLSLQQTAPDLIDALYQARRENRIDLRGKVERLLDHPEPTVREEAVALLLSRWRIADLRAEARRIIVGDPDPGVRARAAIGLAALPDGGHRLADARLLLSFVEDTSVGQILRRACFEALSMMAGQPRLVELDDTSRRVARDLIQEIAGGTDRETDPRGG